MNPIQGENELIIIPLITNPWFDKGEIIYAEYNGSSYVTTRAGNKCNAGYSIDDREAKQITRESHPEYFL